MKKLFIGALFLVSCETTNYVPEVTPQMARLISHAKRDLDPSTPLRTSLTKLERGRNLFVYRCIECHTLPAIWKYSREDWPKIVNSMSHRASLKPSERDAVIAYVLGVRISAR